MSIGFGGNQNAGRTGKDAEITIDLDEIDVLIKKYKGLKKYAKSSLYAVKMMDGNEHIITSMLEETEDQAAAVSTIYPFAGFMKLVPVYTRKIPLMTQ